MALKASSKAGGKWGRQFHEGNSLVSTLQALKLREYSSIVLRRSLPFIFLSIPLINIQSMILIYFLNPISKSNELFTLI